MLGNVKIVETRATRRKIAIYLALIACTGTLGIFLVGAIITSRYFEFANKSGSHDFFEWHNLLKTAGVTLMGAIGVTLTFIANKLSDELWDILRNHKRTVL